MFKQVTLTMYHNTNSNDNLTKKSLVYSDNIQIYESEVTLHYAPNPR